MTPGARVQAAIEILDEIQAGTPAEKVLTSWARRSRFAGSKDRAAVRDHVFDVLRQKNTCAMHGGGTSGRQLLIGILRLQETDLETVFTGAGYGPEALDAAESVAPEKTNVIDLPDWIVPHMQAALGTGFDQAVQHLEQRAPVCLRVNLINSDVPAAIAALALEGIVARQSKMSPTALIIEEGARRVAGSAAYRDGLVELQDASSQAAMDLLPLEPEMRVLDYCAGGGGKTLALAARIKAQYFAHDANAARLRDLPVRAERADVAVQVLDADELQGQQFDLVLCDVPCSGSGTWRRAPDAKWRFTSEQMEELISVQADILETAASLTASKGVLAYTTCSVLEQENEGQIRSFLQRNDTWQIVHQCRWPIQMDGDGFFLTCLQRQDG